MDDGAEQRIKIAQEVINLLEAKKLTAITGRYTLIGKDYCLVCAVGALVVAATGVAATGYNNDLSGSHGEQVMNILKPYFDMRQLALIESAYEGDCNSEPIRRILFTNAVDDEQTRSDYYGEYDIEIVAARKMFGSAVDEDGIPESNLDTRLIEIMRNIIDHKGTFVVDTP